MSGIETLRELLTEHWWTSGIVITGFVWLVKKVRSYGELHLVSEMDRGRASHTPVKPDPRGDAGKTGLSTDPVTSLTELLQVGPIRRDDPQKGKEPGHG